MNLPNKLTCFRVILIPVFAVFMLVDSIPAYNIIALAIFCVACITDFLDGHIARKYNLVTNFGKFMDPLADKVLVSTAMIILVGLGILPSWIAAIIIAREFIISGFRTVAADAGVVIAAGWIGKVKTNFQMFMCIFMIYIANSELENGFYDFINICAQICMWAALVLTIWSLVDYIWKNRQVIADR